MYGSALGSMLKPFTKVRILGSIKSSFKIEEHLSTTLPSINQCLPIYKLSLSSHSKEIEGAINVGLLFHDKDKRGYVLLKIGH